MGTFPLADILSNIKSLSPAGARAPVAAACLAGMLGVASAGGPPVKVEGYFCDAKTDQLAFLSKKLAGDNEIMASNAVNKEAGKASCLPYIVADAVPTSEQTVLHNGHVFVLRSYTFMPENVERWHGTVSGSLQLNAQRQNI